MELVLLLLVVGLFADLSASTVEKVQQTQAADTEARVDRIVSQAHEQVLLERAKHATSKLSRANSGCPHSHGGGKVTKESKLMEERNAVVVATAKMMIESGVETDMAEARVKAQEGYVRSLLHSRSAEVQGSQGYSTAEGCTKPPRVLAMRCGEDEDHEEAECDPKFPFRTITGECNNLNHSSWGSSTTALSRLLPSQYADGVKVPRGGWLSAVEPGR